MTTKEARRGSHSKDKNNSSDTNILEKKKEKKKQEKKAENKPEVNIEIAYGGPLRAIFESVFKARSDNSLLVSRN